MASNGCFIAVLIARTHDHVPLCSYTDENYKNSAAVRQQQQRILERMETPASRTEKSNGSHYQSFDHKDCIYFAFQDAATDLTIIVAMNKLLLRNSGDVGGMNKLACGLIDAIFAEFIGKYSVAEFRATNIRPFQFIQFDTTLQKCISRVVQRDRSGGDSMVVGAAGATGGRRQQVNSQLDAVRQELTDVHFVMRKNLEDLFSRGEKIDTMSNYSSQLVEHSSQYYRKTVHMNRTRLLRMYGPPAAIGFFLLIFFYFYLF